MKPYRLLFASVFAGIMLSVEAQNTFPSVGNTGIGTLTPASSLQVIGVSRLGGNANYAQFSSTGNLSFLGSAKYLVADNSYIFQMNSNQQQGLYFNSIFGNYEFRSGSGTPVFTVLSNSGEAEFTGAIKIGNTSSTIPGYVRWTGTDFEGYTASGWKSFTSTGSFANTSLSNLTSTAVNVNLLPGLDNTRDLGSSSRSWRNAYVDGSIFLQGFRFMHSKDQNVFLGRSTGAAMSTGTNNTFTGSQSGVKNNTGSNNAFFGYQAGNQTTTGSSNTFIGAVTGANNTTGTGNTLVGSNTGIGAGNGSFNTYMGYQSGSLTGSSNIGLGLNTLFLNEGSSNIAIGNGAGYVNKANNNIFIGSSSGNKNSLGAKNIFIGTGSGEDNLSGGSNTYVGDNSGKTNSSGGNNTFIGSSAGFENTTGTNNTFVGSVSGYNNKFGNNNTYLGTLAGGSSNWSNSTAIGFEATTTADNQVRIGNSAVSSIGGFVSWSNVSDSRVKKNVKENIPGLSFINKLRPVSYNFNAGAIRDIYGKDISAESIPAYEKVIHTGFIAQEVMQAAKALNYDFDGVDAPKNDQDLYGLRYSEFVVPLVKAVQELDAAQQAAIEVLTKENEALKKRLEKIEALLEQQTGSSSQVPGIIHAQPVTISHQKTYLEQNAPNPFRSNTVINCYLPAKSSNAALNIYNLSGVLLKSIKVTGEGKNTVTLTANELAAGTYSYALVVDGKVVETKRMVKQ